MNQNETVLREASFNPRVRTYIFLVVLFYLVVSLVGLVLVPFWLLGLGQWLSKKYFHTLECKLSDKHLRFSKGLIFHIEKTIPLENIQDLSFFGGPILRAFGLTLIRIETAGGGKNHFNVMSILGVNDAENYKLAILAQREKVVREKFAGPTGAASDEGLSTRLLMDIKAELSEIKNVLKNQSPKP